MPKTKAVVSLCICSIWGAFCFGLAVWQVVRPPIESSPALLLGGMFGVFVMVWVIGDLVEVLK